jgi:hypothetical protein
MRLAFDLHGVIMSIVPEIITYYKEVLGVRIESKNRFSFLYPNTYNPKRFGPDIAAAIRERAQFAKPMRDSIEALNYWRDVGHDILIITATAKSTMDANIQWLKKYLGLPYTIVRTDASSGKAKPIFEYGVTHFVDDRFKTCLDLSPILTTSFIYDSLHNRREIPRSNMIRINSLYDAMHLIETGCV